MFSSLLMASGCLWNLHPFRCCSATGRGGYAQAGMLIPPLVHFGLANCLVPRQVTLLPVTLLPVTLHLSVCVHFLWISMQPTGFARVWLWPTMTVVFAKWPQRFVLLLRAHMNSCCSTNTRGCAPFAVAVLECSYIFTLWFIQLMNYVTNSNNQSYLVLIRTMHSKSWCII